MGIPPCDEPRDTCLWAWILKVCADQTFGCPPAAEEKPAEGPKQGKARGLGDLLIGTQEDHLTQAHSTVLAGRGLAER